QAEDGIRDGHVTGVQTCAFHLFPTRAASTNTYATCQRGRRDEQWSDPHARFRSANGDEIMSTILRSTVLTRLSLFTAVGVLATRLAWFNSSACQAQDYGGQDPLPPEL